VKTSFGPDSNVITDSNGRSVYLSDAELGSLGGQIARFTHDIAADVAAVQVLRQATSELLEIRDDLRGDNDPAASGRRIGIEDAAQHLRSMADRLERRHADAGVVAAEAVTEVGS
jgi:hypothetical protein